ncbi:MAG: secondary thiamine-phosphate synthase enzyme YjbQ, partial [Syntrophales bacterium]
MTERWSETMKQFAVRTNTRAEMIDITDRIRILVKESRIKSGVCHVFVPHTTAAVTINENADPDVPRDI